MAVVTSETHRLLLPLPNGQESSSTSSGPTSSHRFKEGEEEESVPVLRRHLTLLDGISVLLGIIIGSGIFASPGVVLQHTGSVGLGCIAWLAAAFMALCSALVHAELGAAMPQAGGNAYYLKVAFGDAFSFAFIWTMFFVLVNGSLAIVAISSARYFLIGITGANITEIDLDSDPWSKAIAIACVVGLTICNCFGVVVSNRLQNIISLIKVVLVLLLAVAAGAFLWGSTDVLQTNLHQPFAGSTPFGFGLGTVAALWAFAGGGDIVYLAEEMKDPAKDIPHSTIGGISLVAVIYLIINFIYLCILPAADVKLSSVIAIDATKTALGSWAGLTTALLVAVSVLGTANAIILYGARYIYAAARDGQVPRMLTCLKLLRQQNGAPYVALLAQGAICVLLLLQSSAFIEVNILFSIANNSPCVYNCRFALMMEVLHDIVSNQSSS
ncbi:hypothetical protein BDL97_19G037400 [Sphagnum fallax]|nr:hypothetical protein BDL97_19G037400 [Sphagnum fallax]